MKYKYVCVYELTRHYGGPEEGGWYYDAGTLLKVMPVIPSKWAALSDRIYKWCKRKNKLTSPRYSVLGGSDYEVRDWYRSLDEIPKSFPQERPHYE